MYLLTEQMNLATRVLTYQSTVGIGCNIIDSLDLFTTSHQVEERVFGRWLPPQKGISNLPPVTVQHLWFTESEMV